MTKISIDTIEQNWKKYEKILGRLSDENISRMIDSLGERLAICPVGAK